MSSRLIGSIGLELRYLYATAKDWLEWMDLTNVNPVSTAAPREALAPSLLSKITYLGIVPCPVHPTM